MLNIILIGAELIYNCIETRDDPHLLDQPSTVPPLAMVAQSLIKVMVEGGCPSRALSMAPHSVTARIRRLRLGASRVDFPK